MPDAMTYALRRFAVHVHSEAAQGVRLVDGAGFEDAALGFVEEFHPAPESDDAVSLIVEDCATGERQCFTIHLDTGEAAPCD